jgi:hypothetical protein
MTTATKRKLAKRYIRFKEVGAEHYRLSRESFQELLPYVKTGDVIPLGNGQELVIVDQFEDRNIVWKPTGVEKVVGEVRPQKLSA